LARHCSSSHCAVFLKNEATLDDEAGGATTWIVDTHSGLWIHKPRHDKANLGGCIKLARTLAATFRELADQLFVAANDDVGFHVRQAKSLGADCFNQIRETVIVDIPLAVGVALKSTRSIMPFKKWIGIGNTA
jgi:hypothetical protein